MAPRKAAVKVEPVEEKKEPQEITVGGMSSMGVDYSYTKPEIKVPTSNVRVSMDVCFARYPERFKVIEDKPYFLQIFLPIEVEERFSALQELFNSYELSIEAAYYVKREKTGRTTGSYYNYDTFKDVLSDKEHANYGLYIVRFYTNKLIADMANYYVSLCIFMVLRQFSPGESSYHSDLDRTSLSDKTSNKLIQVYLDSNNGYTGGHRLYTTRKLLIDDLNNINNVDLINKMMPDKESGFKIPGGRGESMCDKKNKYMYTNYFITNLAELVKEAKVAPAVEVKEKPKAKPRIKKV
jgi:hypothetical protein